MNGHPFRYTPFPAGDSPSFAIVQMFKVALKPPLRKNPQMLNIGLRRKHAGFVHRSSETAPVELQTRPTRNFTRFKGFCTEIQGFCTFGCKSPGFRCKNLWKSFGIWIPNPGFLHRNPGFLRFWAQRPWISVQKPWISSIFSLKT